MVFSGKKKKTLKKNSDLLTTIWNFIETTQTSQSPFFCHSRSGVGEINDEGTIKGEFKCKRSQWIQESTTWGWRSRAGVGKLAPPSWGFDQSWEWETSKGMKCWCWGGMEEGGEVISSRCLSGMLQSLLACDSSVEFFWRKAGLAVTLWEEPPC